jgi:hypothetical protein
MRILQILFTLLLSMSSLIAHCGDFESGGFVYSFSTHAGEVVVDENIVAGINAYEGVCIIPETVNFEGDNYAVTAIAEGAFSYSKVTDVVIPNSVTRIGEEAFLGCADLINVTLPLDLQEISRECFAQTSIVSIAIPEGVKKVGYAAFESCHYLHTLMLPSSLKTIAAYAFNDCHNLYEIYCAAVKPPKANAWGVFEGAHNVDVIVSDYEAIDDYLADNAWGSEIFTLFPNEDISTLVTPEEEAFRQDWQRVALGNHLAYKIFDENDELVALTAADSFYLPARDHDVNYAIVPTTMMGDSDPIYVIVEKTAGIERLIDDAFPAEPDPIIIARQGTLYIYGDNYNKMVSVWDMSGRLYYQRISSDAQVIDLPHNRVYIVRVGNYVKKIFV